MKTFGRAAATQECGRDSARGVTPRARIRQRRRVHGAAVPGGGAAGGPDTGHQVLGSRWVGRALFARFLLRRACRCRIRFGTPFRRLAFPVGCAPRPFVPRLACLDNSRVRRARERCCISVFNRVSDGQVVGRAMEGRWALPFRMFSCVEGVTGRRGSPRPRPQTLARTRRRRPPPAPAPRAVRIRRTRLAVPPCPPPSEHTHPHPTTSSSIDDKLIISRRALLLLISLSLSHSRSRARSHPLPLTKPPLADRLSIFVLEDDVARASTRANAHAHAHKTEYHAHTRTGWGEGRARAEALVGRVLGAVMATAELESVGTWSACLRFAVFDRHPVRSCVVFDRHPVRGYVLPCVTPANVKMDGREEQRTVSVEASRPR